MFITLESPTFCNKWLRLTESTEGLITLQGNLKIYYIGSLVHIIYVRLLTDEVQLFFFYYYYFPSFYLTLESMQLTNSNIKTNVCKQ